jgi:decaprenylphospho-beta-D-ribofuranose 2-oxidase
MSAARLKPVSAPAPARPEGESRMLTGWGRTAATMAEVYQPRSPDDVSALLAVTDGRGAVARGLGRSYGDAAQNGGGEVLDMTTMATVQAVDLERGLVAAEGGVSLDRLMRSLVPLGWFVPVTAGTRHVTVGGAIAADIHGKNHHRDGSFCSHVESLTLQTADRTVVAGPGSEPEIFWATAGGMGLTGVVTDAVVRMLPIQTSMIRQDTERADNLDQVMALMESGDDGYRYSVAWVDCVARGASLGRSVLTRGDHAEIDELPASKRGKALAFGPKTPLAAPSWMPSGLVRPVTERAFNELWFRRAPAREHGRLIGLAAFFHPLDVLSGWNRVYGRRGFLQYQLAVPFGAEDVLRTAIESLQRAGTPSSLGVLKRFGKGDAGHLSFPIPGWTLTLDVAVGDVRLARILDLLDEIVAAAGGRIYLAKDSRMRPELVGRMYPRLAEWQKVQMRLDPGGVFQSDLSRRLRLTAAVRS